LYDLSTEIDIKRNRTKDLERSTLQDSKPRTRPTSNEFYFENILKGKKGKRKEKFPQLNKKTNLLPSMEEKVRNMEHLWKKGRC